MILVRNVFQLKFGKAREAVALWKKGAPIIRRVAAGRGASRVLTDLVGPSYTLVLENTFETLADFESSGQQLMADSEWRDWYQQFLPLAEAGRREIFTIVE